MDSRIVSNIVSWGGQNGFVGIKDGYIQILGSPFRIWLRCLWMSKFLARKI